MSWVINQVPHEVFKRNPINNSSVELRFHPILKVDDNELLTSFQDNIRGQFPEYRKENATSIFVDSREQNKLQVRGQVKHIFSDLKGKSFVISQDSLSISSSEHTARADLLSAFLSGYHIFNEVYGELTPQRLGVRYVNLVDKELISSELQEDVSWDMLIKDSYFHDPLGISQNTGVNIKSQIITPVSTGGFLGLQYGLSQTSSVPDCFVIDLDRFIDGDVDLNTLEKQLYDFAADIYSVFSSMAESKLIEWMSISPSSE